MSKEYEDEDDEEGDMFVCVACGDMIPFYRAIFTEFGVLCMECEAAAKEDE